MIDKTFDNIEKSEVEETKPKRGKKVVVQIMDRPNKDVVLVQWEDKDRTRRGFLPTQEVSDNKVTESALKCATPYGESWEELLEEPNVTKKSIAAEMRKHGIWTKEDLLANPVKILKIAARIVEPTIYALVRLYTRGGNKWQRNM